LGYENEVNHILKLASTRTYKDIKNYNESLKTYTLNVRDQVRFEILSNALPIPKHIDIDELITFKSKYQTQLGNFRLYIEEFINTIYNIPEDEISYRTHHFLQRFGQEKRDLENKMKMSKRQIINPGTFCCLGAFILQSTTPYNNNDLTALTGNGLTLLGAVYSAFKGYTDHVNTIEKTLQPMQFWLINKPTANYVQAS